MRKLTFFVMMIFLSGLCLHAQVGINTDGSSAHNSAILDVKSSTKGFLPPRMTHADLAAIESPAEGLVVFCTNCAQNGLGALAMFMDGRWHTLSSNCLVPSPSTAGTHIPSYNQIVWNWTPVADAAGYRWSTINSFATATEMGTSTSYTEISLACSTAYTRYIWAYNSCGISGVLMLNQATTANPASPAAGVSVAYPTVITWNWNPVAGATGYKWNTTNNYASAVNMGTATTTTESELTCNITYPRYVWAYNNCGNSTPTTLTQSTTIAPAQPVAGTHLATAWEITWNWNPVTGATGYKWSTTNNYSAATDMGTATTKTESGLACNTTFTRYIWAYSPCGVSAVRALTQATAKNPLAPVEGNHVPSVTQIVWNWNAVPGATGYKWNSTNNVATAISLGNVLTRTQTGLTCNTPYTSYVWATNACGTSVVTTLTDTTSMSGSPTAPVSGTHTATTSQITWNWNAVSGALGYKWNTTNDYFTATDMGTTTTKIESGLTCATTYNRYVWAYTACGVSPVTILSKATIYCIWICGMPLTDNRDGKIYGTQFIGNQCWMDQNLNVGVQLGFNATPANNGIIEKYCYGQSAANCTEYGGMYQWNEMMSYTASSNTNPSGRQGICPAGWHIPSDAEWCELENYVDASVPCPSDTGFWIGTDAGGKLKETGTSHWNSPNTGATNAFGFNGLPGGYLFSNGSGSGGLHNNAYFFTSTELTPSTALVHVLFYNSATFVKWAREKSDFAYSVRCVKD